MNEVASLLNMSADVPIYRGVVSFDHVSHLSHGVDDIIALLADGGCLFHTQVSGIEANYISN